MNQETSWNHYWIEGSKDCCWLSFMELYIIQFELLPLLLSSLSSSPFKNSSNPVENIEKQGKEEEDCSRQLIVRLVLSSLLLNCSRVVTLVSLALVVVIVVDCEIKKPFSSSVSCTQFVGIKDKRLRAIGLKSCQVN